ncbi:MAG: response regulator transcription factor [Alphaproteobacteria bacterium]|nr:response regulator transcription factor [Alphaproteobacteria bacterium]
MRVLLVEDDKNLGKATAEGLSDSFAVDWCASAEEADDALRTTDYDLVVLDISLPGMSGLDLLKMRRKNGDFRPVLFLTARDSVRHRVEGLNAGADDYLVKPFDLDELIARCSALVRRSQGRPSPLVRWGSIEFDPVARAVTRDGVSVNLSGRELGIFETLIENTGKVLSKAQIEEKIYDWGHAEIESNTVEVHISALRRKLGKETIRTIRGVGYMIPKWNDDTTP